MGRPSWSTQFDDDRAQAERSRGALFAEVADTDVLVIGTHFAAPTGLREARRRDVSLRDLTCSSVNRRVPWLGFWKRHADALESGAISRRNGS
jgi:hypothetical protein